jgi:hypothetical protein
MSIFLGGIGAVNKLNTPIKAVSKRNQTNINKAIFFDAKYDKLNDQRDEAYNNGDERLGRKLDRLCEIAFDKYLDYANQLPATERKRVEKYTMNKF